MSAEREARRLIESGYRCVSNRYCGIRRIDRPDWREALAEHHTPWDLEQGMRWANGKDMGDYYRRVLSKDRREVDPEVYRAMKRAMIGGGWGLLDEYLPMIPANQPMRLIEL